MREIVLHRPHALSPADARHLAETIVRRLRDDVGGTYAWRGDRLCFRRPGARGEMTVTPLHVDIRVSISILLSPLHARIEREIVRLCDEYLGPAAPRRVGGPGAADRVRRSSRSA